MAGPGKGRLAHAVSEAGGFGMFGVDSVASEEWIREQAAVAGAGGTSYGVGLMGWAQAEAPWQLETVLDLKPALVSVSFGDLSPVGRLRDAGILTATQVCALPDLDAAHEAGVDLVVVRGAEGGGHGRNAMATLPLLQMVLDRTPLPVLAAGGILNRRGLAAVLAAGAEGAWVGTAFLACVEASGSPSTKAHLLASSETGYGRVFDVAQQYAWPREYGGRAVANAFFDEWVGHEDEMDEAARARHREGMAAKDYGVAHVYAGQGVAALSQELTAAEVVAEFARAVE